VRVVIVRLGVARVGVGRATEVERGGDVRTTGAREVVDRVTVRVPADGTRETPVTRDGVRPMVRDRVGTERPTVGIRLVVTGPRAAGTGRATVGRYGARLTGMPR
jgi:hypothetical protein